MKRAWLWIALAALSSGCGRQAPQLPYKTSELGTDARCALTPSSGCDALAAAKLAPTPINPPPPVSMKGVVQLVVSLPQQKLYAFRDGVLLATSPVSTGKRGHATPVGHFRILEKQIFHRSNKYDNAPMPYMQRLTEGGVALHAGHLPGYPASHGCIRLPGAFARTLYKLTSFRTPVVVTHVRLRGEKDALRMTLRVLPPQTIAATEPPKAVPAGSSSVAVQHQATAQRSAG
jgi:L,D-transpeptidase catalytic domain